LQIASIAPPGLRANPHEAREGKALDTDERPNKRATNTGFLSLPRLRGRTSGEIASHSWGWYPHGIWQSGSFPDPVLCAL